MDFNKQILELEKEKYPFEHFTREDALRLGTLMTEKARREKLPLVIDIRNRDFILYHVTLDGAEPENAAWVEKKSKMTEYTGMCSLLVRAYIKVEHTSVEEKYGLSTSEYFAAGGAIPICKDGEMLAIASVSGLTHEGDHEFVKSCLLKFLEEQKNEYS